MVRYLLVTYWDWCNHLQCAEDSILVQLADILLDCVTQKCIFVELI